MEKHAQMLERIVLKLKESGLPEYRQSEFIGSYRLFRCSGRSKFQAGTLASPEVPLLRVVLKRLNSAYGIGYTNGRNTEEYKMKLLGYFERELDIWKRAGQHPNIARIAGFMASFDEEIFPALIFHDYPLGDLRTCVEDDKKGIAIPIQIRLQLLRDVASGLCHLHSVQPAIVHRDLMASNVLLRPPSPGEERIVACIADFGSSKLLDPTMRFIFMSSDKSSHAWEPPEYRRPKTYFESYSNPQPSGDVWSFGCTFLEVMTGRDPWPDGCNYNKELNDRKHPPIPDEYKKLGYKKLLKGCWKKSPNDRLKIQDVLKQLDVLIL